jgi:hypothetical protein
MTVELTKKANTIAHYDMEPITAVNSFTVQAPGFNVTKSWENKLECFFMESF